MRTIKNENTRIEFVERTFKNMASRPSALDKMCEELEVNKFLKDNDFLLGEDSLPPNATLACVDSSMVEKQYLTQAQLYDLCEKIKKCYDDLEDTHKTDRAFVRIHLFYREQLGAQDTALSHSIIRFTQLGDKQYCIDSMENHLLDAIIYIGNGLNGKQAVMCAKSNDGNKYFIELTEFCMLSLVKKNANKEKGIFTVFNKKFGLLYSEFVEGSPNLQNAVLLFDSSPESEQADEAKMNTAS
jgi:hypothetical protein